MVPAYDPPDHGEDPTRLTRNLNELLQEIRVAQLGVQILFAFLLSLPFTGRFDATDHFQRVVYFVALLASAGAASMLIAPVAYHRMLFRRRRRPMLIVYAGRFAIAGLALMTLGVSGSVLLVSSFLLGQPGGWIIGGLTFVWFAGWWFGLPIVQRNRTPLIPDLTPPHDPGTV